MSESRMLKPRATLLAATLSALLLQPALADTVANPFETGAAPGPALVVAEAGGSGKCGMKVMDADRDGTITKEEFMKGHEEMFDRMDTNGDGVLDREERQAHRKMMRERKGKGGAGGSGKSGGQ